MKMRINKEVLFDMLKENLEGFGSENVNHYVKWFNDKKSDKNEVLLSMINDLEDFGSENVSEYRKLFELGNCGKCQKQVHEEELADYIGYCKDCYPSSEYANS